MKHFCARPFIGAHISSEQHRCCCKVLLQADPSKYHDDIDKWWMTDTLLNRIRAQFLNDEQPAECRLCWEEEKFGVESMRLNFPIESFDPKVDKIREFSWDVHNKCNLQCKSCSPVFSTGLTKIWDKTAKSEFSIKFDLEPFKNPLSQKQIIESEAFKNAETVNLAGGEIFLDTKFLHIVLDSLIENKNLRALFATINGTLLDEVSITKLKNLADNGIAIVFLISIDGPKKVHEYIRNCDHDKIITNLRRLKQEIPTISFTTNYVLSAFNASNYLETAMSLKEFDIALYLLSFFELRVIDVGVKILPKGLIDYYLEKTQRDEITFMKYLITNQLDVVSTDGRNVAKPKQALANIIGIRKYLIEAKQVPFDPAAWTKFCKMTNMFDKKQGKNILDVYPEFAPYWEY